MYKRNLIAIGRYLGQDRNNRKCPGVQVNWLSTFPNIEVNRSGGLSHMHDVAVNAKINISSFNTFASLHSVYGNRRFKSSGNLSQAAKSVEPVEDIVETPVKPKSSVKRTKSKVNRAKLKRYRELTRDVSSFSGERIRKNVSSLIKSTGSAAVSLVNATGRGLFHAIRHPSSIVTWSQSAWQAVKSEASHYWSGTKLLGLEIRTSVRLIKKRLVGYSLTRRERNQLTRTTADVLRVIPFSLFIIIPFMEFALPFALRLFPNMLPSTFSDQYKEEQKMKNQLKLRLEMAEFLQDMVRHVSKEALRTSKVPNESELSSDSKNDLTIEQLEVFIEDSRKGLAIPANSLQNITMLFSDDVIIDNMSRSDLVLLSRYLGLNTFGGVNLLRYQIRQKVNAIREDDRTIFYEGVKSLNLFELQYACQERGMRATGLSKKQLREQLDAWLNMSRNKHVSISLLILSRAFVIHDTPDSTGEAYDSAVQQAIGQLDEGVTKIALAEGVEELVKEERIKMDVQQATEMKLEAIELQNKMIDAENIEAKEVEKVKKEKIKPEGKHEEVVESSSTELNVEVEPIMKDAAVELDPIEEKEMEEKEFKKVVKSLKEAAEDSGVKEEQEKFEEVLAKQEEIEFNEILAKEQELEEEVHVLEETTSLSKNVESSPVEKITTDEIFETAQKLQEMNASKKGKLRSLLNKQLQRMLVKIQKELGEAEDKIGDKLKLLDLDRDGIVTTAELRQTIETTFCDKYSQDRVDAMIKKLDLDNDGIVTLEQITQILTVLEHGDQKAGNVA
eukprot:maker-scaffold_73-snap-gene-0.1-mRNA-1 protein AED:0.01 eAED:0.01 QI:184/1/1/1/1/1/3/56/785